MFLIIYKLFHTSFDIIIEIVLQNLLINSKIFF